MDEEEDFDEADEFDIDRLLDSERPDRYEADDHEWMEPVVRKLRDKLLEQSPEQVAEDAARRLVHIREGVATQRLNKLLRRFKDGEFPLGFGQDGEEYDWKEAYGQYLLAALLIGGHKVRFGAAAGADIDEWILEQERADARSNTRRAERLAGARVISAALWEQGDVRVEDVRRQAGR